MSEVWKPQPKEVIMSWLDSLQDSKQLSEPLTDWELSFVESIRRQMKYKQSLSQEQQEVIETIYANKTR